MQVLKQPKPDSRYTRSELGHIRTVLIQLRGGQQQITRLVMECRMSGIKMKQLCNKLMASNLINEQIIGKNRIYSITSNGMIFSKQCDEFFEICASINLCIKI